MNNHVARNTLLFLELVAGLAITSMTSAQGPSSSQPPNIASKGPATMAEQLSTHERRQKPGWWPTKSNAPPEDYSGPDACRECHAAIAATQRQSAMARTSTRAQDSEILRAHALDYHLGPYTYQTSAVGSNQVYAVTDGARTISGPLSWSFGIRMGQSWFFEKQPLTLLVPLTYYPDPKEFSFTVDQPHTVPQSLDKALGRPLSSNEVRGCFDCHTTAATTNDHFDPQHAIPGVTCEACHGPGANHIAAAKSGWIEQQGVTMIMNPRHLSPVDSVDYCGACHRTWWDVTLAEAPGSKSLRFQPYRLENSRCWGKGDKRITCVACHDPHRPLVRDTAAYDARCLSCHVTAGVPSPDHPGSACPAAKQDCVSCHMPQYQVVDIPVKFTDHQIRVVRPNAPIPE
ncbi:MAG TPA: multiheme c-type cytochrome [Terriglobales bacterium]|nr:multiheme c-type cytochrome [Terriglobales bacterium]